jgi:hypothetical protein
MNTMLTFTFFAVVLLSLGVLLFITSGQVWEEVVQYDRKCYPVTGSGTDAEWEFTFPRGSIADANPTMCESNELFIHVENDLQDTVYVYYQLENFYQNHRRYVKSTDTDQLAGKYKDVASLTKCEPIIKNDQLWTN